MGGHAAWITAAVRGTATEVRVEEIFADLGYWLEEIGVWAWVVAPFLMAAIAILPVPAEAPAMINGMLFGAVLGSVITWVGAMLGAVISFELARSLGRPLAERLLRPSALEAADRTVLDAGWQGMLVGRFVPLVAFTALNWGAGLTPVPRWRFVWTTAVGIVPGVIVFTASGTGVAALLARLSPVAAALAIAFLAALVVWAYRRQRRRANVAESRRDDEG